MTPGVEPNESAPPPEVPANTPASRAESRPDKSPGTVPYTREYLDLPVPPNARGEAYRLVLHHKEQGRLALPWSPQVGDDYIYAAIPADMMVRTELVTAARAAAGETVTNVLDQFRDVLGTGGTQ